MSAPAAPFSLALFAGGRMLRNALRKKTGRLREPRYLIGFLLGAAYFAMLLSRPGGRAGRVPAALRLPAAGGDLVLLGGAAALAVVTALVWMFRKGRPSLGLTEAEIQFLFPAPVSRKALLSYALLRAQLPVLLSTLIITLVSGRRGSGTGLLTGAGLWVFLTASHFHNLAVTFTKARFRELPKTARRAAQIGTFAAAAGALGILLVTFGAPLFSGGAGLGRGAISSFDAIAGALRTGPFGALPSALLAPFRWILGPLFAADAPAFFRALPPALALVAVLYAWVAWTAVRFEEATLAQAARRAEVRARRAAGRVAGPVAPGKRGRVPFILAAGGRPETAILWKNLVSWKRTSLARQAALVGALAFALFAISAFLAGPRADGAAGIASATCLAMTSFLALFAPLGFRIDLRGDLEEAAVLKTWPVKAERLVLAELAAPAAVAVLYCWGGIAIAIAIVSGRAARAAFFGAALPASQFRFLRLEVLAPVALALAVVLPGLIALILIVQNAAVLALPAWFPPGRARSVGLEQSGLRMLSFLGTSLVLAVALVPAALLAAPLLYVTSGVLGPWALPLAAALGTLPILAETALGIALLARLFERFDPARDLSP